MRLTMALHFMISTTQFPDTLYLPDRAELAINCLLGVLNPEKACLPYCLTDLTSSPPRMAHTQFDFSDHAARVLDALLLARAMTGSDRGSVELEALVSLVEQGFAEDGLHYTPENPWSFRHANMHYQRSVINSQLSLALVQNSDRARNRLHGLIEALDNVSIRRDGFAYFPTVERHPDGWPRGDWKILGFGTDPANTNGRLIVGLTRAAALLSSDRARALAGAYVQHVMHHSSAYLPDGSFATGMEFREGHFHSRAVTMLGVIRYGISVGDSDAVDWGKMVFDRACRYGTRAGWFPERLVESRAHGCETCAIVDMMEAALLLGTTGRTEYFGIAERFLRNQLVESQLTTLMGLEEVEGEDNDEEWETSVRVAQRSLGGFAGWSQPNDLFSRVMHQWDLYTCCSAQGVRGLFSAWTQAVTVERNLLRVNLLINSISQQAIVQSWLPDEGKLAVTPLCDTNLLVRLPDGVAATAVSAQIHECVVADHRFEGGYIRIDGIEANTTVTLTMPVPTSTHEETILGTGYTTTWRGDTQTNIAPDGSRMPLFRDRQRTSEATGFIKRASPVLGFSL